MEPPNQPELREAKQILWELADPDLRHAAVCFCFLFDNESAVSSQPSSAPSVGPTHLNALNTSILHLNILHTPTPLTCNFPPILTFFLIGVCCFDI